MNESGKKPEPEFPGTPELREPEGPIRNFNDVVLVKITPAGERIYREYYKDPSISEIEIRRDREGFTRMQLWEVANIFGPHLESGLGIDIPIETEFRFLESKE